MQLLKQLRPIEDFIPHVISATINESSQGISENFATSLVRNAAITFADKSGALTREITVDLQCGLSEYPIEMLDCETVVGIQWARLGDFEQGPCEACEWNFGNVCFAFEDDVLKISPAPKEDIPAGLTVKVVVTPSREACKLDEQFYTKWFDALIYKVHAELYWMAGQAWSSVTRAQAKERLFNEEVSRLSIRKTKEGRREPRPLQTLGHHPWASHRRRRFY